MFSINIYVKFALIALFLGGGILLSFIYGIGYSWILILIGLILLATYILLGTVQSAAQLLQTSDFEAAEKRLNLTPNPKFLFGPTRGYYYIIKGSIAMQAKNTEEAEAHFLMANEQNLPSDNEKGMVLLQLAGLSANKQKWTVAQNYYRDAKKLKITETQLKEQLDMFGKQMKQAGATKGAQGMMGRSGSKGRQMQPGGKRRRPKMR